ncbi:LOW QUALITY PROTEIN: HERV-H LTR-associating protein 2 [Rhynchonycteris naso]
MSEQIVIGRLDEHVILPCSFESEPKVLIHWKNQDNNVYTFYKDSDHLKTQDLRYTNNTLFHSEIHNGNASLSFRRLSLLDEGIYLCYVETIARKNKVVLKMTLNNVGLNHTRQLKNILIENILLSCKLANYFFLLNQNNVVTSRVESGTFSILAYFLSSSQNKTDEPQLSWNKELINQSNILMILRDLSHSDSGEYLCNISSSKYTLTFQTLHVGIISRVGQWV